MRHIKTLLKMLSAIIIALAIASCDDNGTKALLRVEIKQLQKNLPMEVDGTDMQITAIEMNGDMVRYTVEVDHDYWDDYGIGDEEDANSDLNVASIVEEIDDAADTFIKAGVGIEYVYKDKDSGETLLTITVSPERLKDIKSRLDEGTLDSPTLIDRFQEVFDSMELPTEIEEGVVLRNAYVKGNSAFYEVETDMDVSADDITADVLQTMKDGCMETLRNELGDDVDQVKESEVNIVYIYHNADGEVFATVRITPDDF